MHPELCRIVSLGHSVALLRVVSRAELELGTVTGGKACAVQRLLHVDSLQVFLSRNTAGVTTSEGVLGRRLVLQVVPCFVFLLRQEPSVWSLLAGWPNLIWLSQVFAVGGAQQRRVQALVRLVLCIVDIEDVVPAPRVVSDL